MARRRTFGIVAISMTYVMLIMAAYLVMNTGRNSVNEVNGDCTADCDHYKRKNDACTTTYRYGLDPSLSVTPQERRRENGGAAFLRGKGR